MQSVTETLAHHWAGVRYQDLPDEVIQAAKRALLDTLAAGVAGASTDVVTAVKEAASFVLDAGGGSSILWGDSLRLPAPQAALVNGTAAHALELDDFGGCGHSGAVVVPAVCAVADRVGASGEQTLTAIVTGYDIAARVLEGAGGYRSHNEAGWHSTGTCGSFGAAAGTAKLLSLDARQFTHALGIAGTFTGGTWAFLSDGAMTKRFHPGKAAETGLSAALLSRAGMTGPRFMLEADWGGFFGTYSGEAAVPEAALAGLGLEFRILESGIKPYACCRGMHGCVDSLLDTMTTHGFGVDAIERMTVHGAARTRRQFARQRIETLLDAQFSFPYALAVAAESGRAGLDQFEPLRHEDPTIRRLMAATEVVDDRTLGPEENPTLEIRLRDGRRFSHQTSIGRGAPERPLSERDRTTKATSLMTPTFGESAVRDILTMVRDLESLDDVRRLTTLLARPSVPTATA